VTGPLLAVEGLRVSFAAPGGRRAAAVRDVSFSVHPGQTLAVVGESGSGKSVTALSILRLLPSGAAIDAGRVAFRRAGGRTADLAAVSLRELRSVRGGEIAMIFQEPMTSLNPLMTVGDQIAEAVLLHQTEDKREALAIAARSLADVGLADAHRRLRDFPHQFSGGMRQRVMIAMALACKPSLLIADEPTTALDVTVQAQVLALLGDLRHRLGLAVILISHDLGVVARYADVVCVMYAGRVVEYAAATDLFDRPLHPYTRGLLRCAPRPGLRVPRLATIAEVIDEEWERGLAGGSLRAWWPGKGDPGAEPSLAEIEPGRWVCVLGPHAARPSRPDVGARRAPALPARA